MSDEQEGATPPQELLKLREDLSAYDNPESFYDPDLPLLHRFRIVNLNATNLPTILKIEVEGLDLHQQLTDGLLSVLKGFAEAQLIEDYGVQNWDEVRTLILNDEEFSQKAQQMYLFFARHLPKLFLKTFNILFLISQIAALRDGLGEREKRETESGIKSQLAANLRGLEKEIYRMLDTRSQGRPLGSTKPLAEKAAEAAEFEAKIEITIRKMLSQSAEMPTKTAVAKQLGIGGLSPRSGTDSSLSSFNSKLKRMNLDYATIAARVEDGN